MFAGVAATALAGAGGAAPLIGWDILALVYGAWVWSTVWSGDPASAESDAKREDPSHDLADLVVLGAAIASLIAVGVVLFGAGGGQRKHEVPGRRSRSRLRIRVLDSRPHGIYPEIRAALLFGQCRRNQLQRHRRTRLYGPRLPPLNDDPWQD